MERGRDRRYDDRPLFHHNSYRGSGPPRSPPRGDSGRGPPRSPPSSSYRGRPIENNYRPIRGGRGFDRPASRSPPPRSRSPGFRGRGDGGFHGRARSPPRRSRSPLPYSAGRNRSPLPARGSRDASPYRGFRQRSPLRFAERGGRDDYDRRGPPPPRDEPARFSRDNSYRPAERHSRSPPHISSQPSRGGTSRGGTPISSRRSSPPVHPDRMLIDSRPPPASNLRRETVPDRPSPAPYRSREQSPRRQRSPAASLPHVVGRGRSPPPRNKPEDVTPASWSASQMTPTGPRQNDARYAHATRQEEPKRDERPRDLPSAPISMSAHTRTAPPTAPSGPSRGGSYISPPRGRGYPPPRHASSYDSSVPTGPRVPNLHTEVPRYPSDNRTVPFRGNFSGSTTYPRTLRVSNNPATTLNSATTIIPGGKKLPSLLDPQQEKKLEQLEEERKKLLELIEEKQRIKRARLRAWAKAERESARDALRSELAEGHLDRLSGEGMGGGAAY